MNSTAFFIWKLICNFIIEEIIELKYDIEKFNWIWYKIYIMELCQKTGKLVKSKV